ncbi:hypothetical protein ETB97_008825 [Aspergillus alliaceus]|uniref:NACHT domain-containing protein n=1 Tax=Petromyces alliaceus TaxID=209559 RepID=A0A8H5ZWH4_PETAA|nr:hypothetical protein ETB97_008825 [Aspergillus burnettii]
MAEALGIASGIAGIISLGLEITQGLLQYYSLWRNQDKDIRSMYNSLSNFSELLVQLQHKIQPPAKFDIEVKRNVEWGIEAALDNVKQLETELGKIKATDPLAQHGVQATMRRHILRMKYPFKVETLRNIQTNISESRSNLSFAIQLLHIDKISEAVERVDLIIRWKQDNETREVIDWLCPVNFWLKQADVLKQRQPGTGDWLLQDSRFLDWETGSRESLWCRGSPGVGKTVLSSVVIDFLETDLPAPDISLAFIYCNYKLSQVQNLEYFYRAIARQLVELKGAVPESVTELYQRHRRKGTAPTEEECLELIQSLTKDSAGTYIVIDALDECVDENDRPFWTKLIGQLKSSIINLHLLCTSRHIDDPRGVLENATHVEIRASRADIETYVEERIESSDNLLIFCKQDPRLRHNIMEVIVSKSDGMFLIAQLYIELLGAKDNLRALKKSLQSLPEQIDDLYDEAVQRLQSSSNAQLALRAISWIIYSFRPLQLIELQHAVAIDELEPDDEDIPEECLTDQTKIINACIGLIRIDKRSQTIGLVHYTAQDYFDRKGSDYFPHAQVDIGVACVRNPFLEYATRNGHESAVKLLLDQGAQPDSSDTYGQTPLSCAAQEGHESVVKLLLYQGAQPDSSDERGQTPLSYAAEKGHESVVKLLLYQGAQPNSSDKRGRTPLSYAAQKGHESVVKLLLYPSAQPDSTDKRGWTPLSCAARGVYKAVVKLLPDQGAQPDSKDEDGQTPLFYAARNGHESVVKLLLYQGTQPDSSDKRGRTPLSYAADKGHKSVVKLLLDQGAHPGSKDKYGRTPLSYAADNGHESLVKLLLKQGAHPGSKDKCGRTPLSYAADKGHESVVKLLLYQGAQPNSSDNRGRTPVFYAAYNGHESVVKLLDQRA